MSKAYTSASSELAGTPSANRPPSANPIRAMIRSYRKHPVWAVIASVVTAGIILLALGGYFLGWTWTGFEGNTFWDWLSLLITPVTLGVVSIIFSIQQNQGSTAASDILRQEALLQAYLDQISRLLLDANLRESPPDSPVRAVARAHTLATLHRVGDTQKDVIVRFLDASGLLAHDASILDLHDAGPNYPTDPQLA